MNKKIKCKHGLDNKEEIQARRLKDKLVSGDKESYLLLGKYFLEWTKINKKINFDEFLKNKDMVLYSAYMRAILIKPEIISSLIIS